MAHLQDFHSRDWYFQRWYFCVELPQLNSTDCPRCLPPSMSLSSSHFPFIQVPFRCLHVQHSLICQFCFAFFHLYLLPLYLSLSPFLRTCRWHGAWPEKAIPHCWGLPGRDSLGTVSLLLARSSLPRGGRPEPTSGGKKERQSWRKFKKNGNGVGYRSRLIRLRR